MKKSFLFIVIVTLLLGWPFSAAWADDESIVEDEPQRYRDARAMMVERQIASRGVADPLVLKAMRMVPRHLFVPDDLRSSAYNDYPLPIGEGQTISQPYIVAVMTETLQLTGSEKVLEIGTGSGYQAAVLSLVAAEVFSIEIKEVLYERSKETLQSLEIENVSTRHGDGYFGWEEEAPFDAIMITAAVDHIPQPLLAQLKDGGQMVLPLGDPFGYTGQMLILVEKHGEETTVWNLGGVRFVPMTGRALE
jgi:protein-L-isoaspartate(D-aspartate) O-methyltransferase